jgi:V/A-type H+/Na+-transporting ATPase subunit E
MATNLDQLTEKIYQEGIDKARKEADEIIDKARKEAEEIISKSKEKADTIIKEAGIEAETMQKNTLADVKLAADQSISALKQQIRKLISKKILEDPLKDLFSDQSFLKDLILNIVGSWKPDSEVLLTLPEGMQQKFDKALESSIKKETKGLQVQFDKRLSAGFRVAEKDQDYTITFTDEDFAEFFRPYLRSKTEDILFKDSKAS